MALFSHVIEINRDDFKQFVQERFGKNVAVGFSDFSDSAVIRFENMNQILVASSYILEIHLVRHLVLPPYSLHDVLLVVIENHYMFQQFFQHPS